MWWDQLHVLKSEVTPARMQSVWLTSPASLDLLLRFALCWISLLRGSVKRNRLTPRFIIRHCCCNLFVTWKSVQQLFSCEEVAVSCASKSIIVSWLGWLVEWHIVGSKGKHRSACLAVVLSATFNMSFCLPTWWGQDAMEMLATADADKCQAWVTTLRDVVRLTQAQFLSTGRAVSLEVNNCSCGYCSLISVSKFQNCRFRIPTLPTPTTTLWGVFIAPPPPPGPPPRSKRSHSDLPDSHARDPDVAKARMNLNN